STVSRPQGGEHPVDIDIQQPQSTCGQQIGLQIRVLITAKCLLDGSAVDRIHIKAHPRLVGTPPCYCLAHPMATPDPRRVSTQPVQGHPDVPPMSHHDSIDTAAFVMAI